MSAAKDKMIAAAERLRRQVADAEGLLSDLRAKLACAEAKLTGAPAPVTGLDLLWAAAVPKSRERSSKQQCRTEWSRIPKSDRPTVQQAVAALKIWNRSEEWKSEGNRFAPGLHRFIQRRMWEDLPEGGRHDPHARYQTSFAPPPKLTAEDAAALAEFLKVPVKRMTS